MKFSELVRSSKYKKAIGFIYGMGAAVVLVGALFKIEHLPGASIMLMVGLLTEAVIFAISAFEPPHEEYDWSLVYPELAGIDESIEIDDRSAAVASKKTALERFDAMIESAEISPELFEKLGHGLQNMSQTAEKLSDVSSATVATNNYVANFEKASEKVNEFADVYGNSASKLNQSADKLADTYGNSADVVGKSGNELAAAYQKLTQSMNEEFEKTSGNTNTYGEQLESMTKNLTALNAAYELQLQGTNEHLEKTKDLYGGLNDVMSDLNNTVEDTKRFREEVSKLGNNLAAMNTVYGNMLSAMNVKQD
ncbi:MAG: gliding motility protein GldL [Bacteroidales bacterium]|jgi:chromosome segregation ATPase|nr:gliding motility protein GldL [Bacteroidales bacterium]